MPFERIAAIVVAYVLIATLLLSLNIASRWRWWVKASATVLCGLFFVASYVAIASLPGWPTSAQVPQRFSLLATRVVEPSQALGESGAIYLWVERLDEDNVPSGPPLNYRIPYTAQLARTVSDAQAILDQGEDVEASLQEVGNLVDNEGREADAQARAAGNPSAGSGANADAADYVPGVNLIFNEMPPVRLPEKGAL